MIAILLEKFIFNLEKNYGNQKAKTINQQIYLKGLSLLEYLSKIAEQLQRGGTLYKTTMLE